MDTPTSLPNGGLHGLEPIVVTSDLSAARASFAVPQPCKLIPDGSSGTGKVITGGGLILVGVNFCLVTDATNEGFTLNHVDYAGTVTPVFRRVLAAAGTLEGYAKMWIPFQGPTRSGSTARNGGKLSLTLTGTPVSTSFVVVELRHHTDPGYSNRFTLGGDVTLGT